MCLPFGIVIKLINDFGAQNLIRVGSSGSYQKDVKLRDIVIAMAASSNPDILYLDEAMKAEDWPQFHEAMGKEVNAHEGGTHWGLVKRADLPEGTEILPAVWAMISCHLFVVAERLVDVSARRFEQQYGIPLFV